MIRTSIALAAVLMAASPALAEGVHVSLVGKSATTIRADIKQAALKACEDQARESPLYHPDRNDMEDCVSASVRVALLKTGRSDLLSGPDTESVVISAR